MMRPLRWKNKYLTGQAEIDQRTHALVELLNTSLLKSNQVEHCQDLNELHQCLLDSAETLLSQVHAPDFQLNEQDLRELLSKEFPLSARNKTACRDCGRCEELEQQLKEWVTPSS